MRAETVNAAGVDAVFSLELSAAFSDESSAAIILGGGAVIGTHGQYGENALRRQSVGRLATWVVGASVLARGDMNAVTAMNTCSMTDDEPPNDYFRYATRHKKTHRAEELMNLAARSLRGSDLALRYSRPE